MQLKSVLLIAHIAVFSIHTSAQAPWSRITPTPQEHTLNDITQIPGSGKIIAVGEGSTIMTSEDLGETWDILLNPAGMNNQFVCNSLFFIDEMTGFIGGGREQILKTTDGGTNWELKYSSGILYDQICINDICFMNDSTGFATGHGGLLLKTTNAGETWIEVESGVNLDLNEIVMIDNQTAYILSNFTYDAKSNLWLKTSDSGNTWITENIPALIPNGQLTDLYFVNDTVGFMHLNEEWDGSLFKTTDAGQTWNLVFEQWGGIDCRFNFSDEQHGVAVLNTWMYYSKVLVTEDGGNTWVEILLPGGSLFVNALCNINQSRIITVGTNGEILISNNNGFTWEEHYQHQFYNHIYSVQFTDINTGYILSDGYGGGAPDPKLFKTFDGGFTWNVIGNDNFYHSVRYFMSNGYGFLATQENEFNFTTDGGYTWLPEGIYTGFECGANDIQFYDNTNGIIAGYKVILTSDGGFTWQDVSPNNNSTYADIEYISEDTIFISGSNDYVNTAVFKSTDEGHSWSMDIIGDYRIAKDICFLGSDTAFLVCSNKILKSVDGCSSWDTVTINYTGFIDLKAVYFAQNVGYAIGDGEYENLFKSTDGGYTWNPINSGTSSALNGLYFSDADNGFVFGDYGVVMHTTTGGVVSVEKPELPINSSFLVYPNPAVNDINIKLTNPDLFLPAQLELFNITGKQLGSYTINNTSDFVINSSFLKQGIYLLRFTNKSGLIEHQKVIVF